MRILPPLKNSKTRLKRTRKQRVLSFATASVKGAFIVGVISFSSLRAFDQSEEIKIYLPTTASLEPLYLGKVTATDSSLDIKYLAELEKVLFFDFSHIGSFKIASPDAEKEKILKHPSVEKAFERSFWRGQKASFVGRAVVREKKLTFQVLSVKTGSLKSFADVELVGNLSKDRRALHALVDRIQKALFDEEGVASTHILFSLKGKTSKGEGFVSEIWVCDWDGANLRQLTKEGNYTVSPVVVPSGKNGVTDRFLYVSYKQGQPKIFIASTGDGVGKRLIDLKGNQMLPAISPTRDKIAFICDAGGRTDLFLQQFSPEQREASKPFQLFSFPRSTQASPTFSPDGKKIAFVSDMSGTPRIYSIPSTFVQKRAEPELLSKTNKENSCPSWSPDGKRLAYSAKTEGVRQIWIYDFETKKEWQLTDGPGNKENPSWAPNGKHLVFNSADGQFSELYIVNLNQPDVVKISHGPGVKHYPAWGH